MATLNEVLRGTSFELSTLAGRMGLGREVRRVLHVTQRADLAAPAASDDLVVCSIGSANGAAASNGDSANHVIMSLLKSGVAGVVADSRPDAHVVRVAEKYAAPLLVRRNGVEPASIVSELTRSIERLDARVAIQKVNLQSEFADLARSGAAPVMLLQRLVEHTGKTCLLECPDSPDVIRYAASQRLEPSRLHRAIGASAAAVKHWILDSTNAAPANPLYLELAAEKLVRLVAPVWFDGQVRMVVSLFAQPDQLNARDRVGMLAAVRSLARTHGHVVEPSPPVGASPRPHTYAGLVIRAPHASAQALATAAGRCLDVAPSMPRCNGNELRLTLPYVSVEDWYRHVREWHLQLTRSLGSVTIGHAPRRRTNGHDDGIATVQAAEAAAVGDVLFGPGRITSFAEAQLARFFLREHDAYDLRSLYERAVGPLVLEDDRRDGELVSTLQVYCETLSTQRTAERLAIHRNTVLYRLKRIEEITSADLEDGPTRLFLQLGLLAGRLSGSDQRHQSRG